MNPKPIFVNTQVPIETDIALRMIAEHMQVSRSDIVRQAIKAYLMKFEDVIKVTTLPRPDGAAPVPVITLNPEFLENSKLEG